MRSMWRRLAGDGAKFFRDYLLLAGGQTISKLFGFLAFAWLARVLDPVDYGAVEYVVGLSVFFAILVDGGLGVIGTRRSARDKSQIALLAFQIPVARLMLATLGVPLMAIVAILTMRSTVPPALVLLFALSLFTAPWRQQWLFQATERMADTAMAEVLRMAVFAIIVWFLVRSPHDILAVGWAEIAAVTTMTAYCIHVQHRSIARVRLTGSMAGFGALVREGLAVGSSNFVWALNQYAPLFLIASFIGGVQIAWFAAASRVITSLVSFSSLYHFNLYPSVARAHARGNDVLGPLLMRSLRVTAWSGCFAALVLTVFATPLIRLALGPKLLDAAPLLAVMAWMLPVALWSGHSRWALAAAGAQTQVLWSQTAGLAVTVVASVGLGFYLGALGYALGALAGFVAVWLASDFFAARRGCMPPPRRLTLLPLGLAGAIIAAVHLLDPGFLARVGLVAIFAVLAPLLDRQLIADLIAIGGAKRDTHITPSPIPE